MKQTILINGEPVTRAQLSQWRREFGGAFVDAQGCLLICADDEHNWFVLNAHVGFFERNNAFAGEMPDGLGGYVGHGATVREFIAAARRLKAQREVRDIRDAHEQAEIESAFAERRWVERVCAGAVGCDGYQKHEARLEPGLVVDQAR